MIVDDWYLPNNKTQKMELAAPKIIASKGSYKDYILQTKNGNKYASSSITNIIGYKSLSDIFEKV